MILADLISRPAVMTDSLASVAEAARRMRDRNVGSCVVALDDVLIHMSSALEQAAALVREEVAVRER